jgi:hypothetical protein
MTKGNSNEIAKDDLLEIYASFIKSYDGSEDAFKNSEKFMKDLFHPGFTFLTEEGPKNLRWYRDFAISFASRPSSAARVTHLEWTGVSSMQVTILNVVAGVELDPITYNGNVAIDEDGKYKICHFEPVNGGTGGGTSNMENVEKMVQLATNLPVNIFCQSDDDNVYHMEHSKSPVDRQSLVMTVPASDILWSVV